MMVQASAKYDWRSTMTRDEILKIYDEAVGRCSRFHRKGKTMPYTSANGHMFSLLTKKGEFGIRFSKEVQMKYMEKLETTHLISYGAVMKGYIVIPEAILADTEELILYLNEGYDYVRSLDPK